MKKNRFKGFRAIAIEKPNKTDHLPIEVSNELLDDCYFENHHAEIVREIIKGIESNFLNNLNPTTLNIPKSNRINPDGAPATPISKVLSGIQSLRDSVRNYWKW